MPSFRSKVVATSALLAGATIAYMYQTSAKRKWGSVSVINLTGIIQANTNNSPFGGTKLNLDGLSKSIDKAFAVKNLKEVCLKINCPGGSPVQSELIANRIMHLSRTKNVDVVSFVEDTGASGGYWLACAGKEIYVCENSITGSIGAVSSSFGFHKLIEKYNIDRRVKTAGKNKAIGDPFQEEKPEDVEIMQQTLNKIHLNFINYVKKQRGARLCSQDEEIFTGRFWVGEDAVHLGLVDGVKTLNDYLYEKYGDNINVVPVNSRRKAGLAGLFSSSLLTSACEDLQNSSAYAKYKLM